MAKKKAKGSRLDKIHRDIARKAQRAEWDSTARRRLIKSLETADTRVGMYYSRRDRSLTHDDTLPILNMLKSVGVVQNLDFIVASPGGDGTAAESILDILRQYCKGKLRIVVPQYAKSAATLIALGADEIVMGESSELGPIDAQVMIIQDNAPQQVSADHFLRAYSEAVSLLKSAEPSDVEAGQIQISLLSPAFLQNCQDLMAFAKDVARAQLKDHMLKSEMLADAGAWEQRIDAIAENLTSSSARFLHGRMITAQEIAQHSDLKYLKVTQLASGDDYWNCLNELLLRTETVLHSHDLGKVVYLACY